MTERSFHDLTPAQQEHLLNGPGLTPPPGVTPHFVSYDRRNPLSYGVFIAGTGFASLIVMMRLYVKIRIIKRLRMEDFLMVSALGIYIGCLYIALEMLQFPGAFEHQWNIRLRDIPILLKGANTGGILYALVFLLLKTSILLDWMHIFVPQHGMRGGFYYACIANIVVGILFYVAYIFIELFGCIPRSKMWNFFEPGKCVNIFALRLSTSVFNFVVDVIMLVMPQKVIWQLNLSARRKTAVSLLFTVAAIGCVCGLLRIVYSVPYLKSADKTYHMSSFSLLALLEGPILFLVLCVPSTPKLIKETPLLREVGSRLKGLFRSSTPKENSRLELPSWIRTPSVGRRRYRDPDMSILRSNDTAAVEQPQSDHISFVVPGPSEEEIKFPDEVALRH